MSDKRRPVLGIIACQRRVGIEPAQTVIERYIRPTMRYADVAALIVPSLPDLMGVAEVAPLLDGVLLTGSPSNVAPERYGEEAGEGPFDPGRDDIAMGLVDAMTRAGKPVFGICRGFQEINVALGGTLRRDTSASDDLLRHHAPDDVEFNAMFDHLHPVELIPGGVLAQAFGKDRITVNSVHFQGVGRLADGLAVEATAPDGLVEAYSTHIGKAPVIAVQWHPEWGTEDNEDSQAFFRLLGRTLRGEG
ncbi:gamma-glutamyl-gamma-aminobutyrate hydrolase family protein [Alteraurantiacibacter buctensis]|uniref:Gamma-glutamyl-gamma-aminobutyrate hydrolase family protein n=1 Tax=Alteraurantiacibacter buctensis TaxID=1503981 RepID=A0A844YVP2_9SPHN|nr:gamma-glutamyl-gamma-aminobutyrate hydrolase family protein [Alteraurantiacibacter buctensis]MXO71090.1 gamma-glutamyl-gamma-aminobutyrate hydrolase family protein [Alteraurantiacibacter buctensis]